MSTIECIFKKYPFVEFVPLCRNARVQFLKYDISFYYIPFYNISISGCDYLKNGEKMADKYLMETRMLDFSNLGIQELIHNLKWKELDEFERVKAIYNYVRDDIVFGYNIDDEIQSTCRRLWTVQYKRDAIHGPFACLRYSMQNTRFYNR